jgi:Periplasmic protease
MVMKKHSTILLICLFASFFASCEKAFFAEEIENTPSSNFDYLWNRVDREYAFFDVKNVDWDAVYSTYRPLIEDEMSDDSLFAVMAAMLNTLQDGHTNLFAPFSISHSDSIFYKKYGKSNIDKNLVMLNYLGSNMMTTGGFYHNTLRNGEVGYVYYPSFSNETTDNNLIYIFDRYKNAKGIVFDIRQNGGGYIANLWILLRHFICDGRKLYETQIKAGPSHNDFSPLETVHASKTQNFQAWVKPFIILTDRGTYSASSFFSICSQAYDNMILVGDTTGGGLGLPNGGQIPNGWCYRFSITRNFALDGNNYENGVPPQFTVLLDKDLVDNGIDNIIEFACDKILEMNP